MEKVAKQFVSGGNMSAEINGVTYDSRSMSAIEKLAREMEL